MLFHFGATTQRIQDSIAWLARFLGCEVEVLVSYDALMITVHDGPTFRTRIDSSRGVAGLNLMGLVRVSQLVRGLPGCRSNAEEVEEALCGIRDTPPVHGVAVQALAAGCAGAGFCIVNSGDPASWVCSFLVAAFIFAIRRRLTALKFNVQMTLFVIAFAGSLLAGLLARLTQTATPAIALLAPCLFLVPGVPMINGGVDIVRNHVTMGIARIGFTLVVLLVLSLGVGLTVPLFPLRISAAFSMPGAWEIAMVSVAGALAAGALACLNNGGLPFIALCALGGLIGRLIRALVTEVGFDVIKASLLGALCSSLVVIFIADGFKRLSSARIRDGCLADGSRLLCHHRFARPPVLRRVRHRRPGAARQRPSRTRPGPFHFHRARGRRDRPRDPSSARKGARLSGRWRMSLNQVRLSGPN